jgi:DNA adenine methylase
MKGGALKKPRTNEFIEGDSRPDAPARPFLKWVGGKSQLLSELLPRFPKKIKRYFEPFLGGGAAFFGLHPGEAVLSDLNEELVNVYVAVRDDVEALIAALGQHRYDERYFYAMRERDRADAFARSSPVERASRLIYLNKTCYNGLYRLNAKGFFNTPFGRYSNPKILDRDNLRACSKALRRAEIHCAGFAAVLEGARRGDFVYFDPPYLPLSATSSFTAYRGPGFGLREHTALRDVCAALDAKGVSFVASNSSSPLVFELYCGFRIEKVLATRAINSNGRKRGAVVETLISNCRTRA